MNEIHTIKTSELPNIAIAEIPECGGYGENYVQQDITSEEFEAEEWAKVPNEFLTPEAHNTYFVSSLGRVYCSGFTYKRKKGKVATYKPRFNKIHINKKNYYTTGVGRIFINNRRKIISVHQLMMMAFDEHIPAGNTDVVDHFDNCQSNNRLENLHVVSNHTNICKDRETLYTGVYLTKKGKIYSQIDLNGSIGQIKLGYYPTLRQGAFAYLVAREFKASHPGKKHNRRFIKFIKDVVSQIVAHFGDDFEAAADDYFGYPAKKEFDFSVIEPDFTILTTPIKRKSKRKRR